MKRQDNGGSRVPVVDTCGVIYGSGAPMNRLAQDVAEARRRAVGHSSVPIVSTNG